MARNAGSLPRKWSTADAFLYFRNPEAANAVRGDITSMLNQTRQRNSQLDDFANSLPKLSEKDLETLGHSDSTCPICLTSLLAILAEEEMAIAMDSPAHPVEELGVTRLVQTCGHIFCRKDIRGWLHEGHTTCPTCRTPFFAPPLGPSTTDAAQPFTMRDEDAANAATFDTIIEGMRAAVSRGDVGRAMGINNRPDEEDEEEVHFEYNHGRDEFSGMYS